jgi:RNA 3'-terminal phosphate cyclase (ATP)
MIKIDGSKGEGGGQVIRSALTLSLLTGQSVQIEKIRAGRTKPGLRAQHLTAVQAAVEISQGRVEGAAMGSLKITFHPGDVRSGRFAFEIPTAGSACLVLQTIWLPLALSNSSTDLTITGGTHVPWSPCFEYIERCWCAFMALLGYPGEVNIHKAGYYPKGGGIIHAKIQPGTRNPGIELLNPGRLNSINGVAGISGLPDGIVAREIDLTESRLEKYGVEMRFSTRRVPALDKGNYFVLVGEFERSRACFFGLGARGKPAEVVADEAINALESFLQTGAAIDPFMADQILLPLAFTSGKSRFTTSKITSHLKTNASVIEAFGVAEIEAVKEPTDGVTVTIQPSDH